MSDRKSQQKLFLAIAVAMGFALLLIVYFVLSPKQFATAQVGLDEPTSVDLSIISDRTSAAAPEMSWITSSRSEIQNLRNLTDSLRLEIEAERNQRGEAIAGVHDEYQTIIQQQILKIAELEAAIEQVSVVPRAVPDVDDISGSQFDETGSEFIRARVSGVQATPFPPATSVRDRSALPTDQASLRPRSFGSDFELTAVEEPVDDVSVKTLRNYIPAGSYAPAIVLSGADAATNVINRESPIPVLFRISGPAVTAGIGRGRGALINITGCTVQGSAIGDLSSERVLVRLLTLTCIKTDGSVLETEISGYMTGSGKAGVRGRVVSREGNLVTKAGIAGALQGLSSAVSGSSGAADDSTDIAGIAEAAAAAAGAGGVEQAATTLSEYYINRAEQYQPVITLSGGTSVELVFLEGVSLE